MKEGRERVEVVRLFFLFFQWLVFSSSFSLSLFFPSNSPNCLAISRPMPEEPPVTRTVCVCVWKREKERVQLSMMALKNFFFFFLSFFSTSNYHPPCRQGGPSGRERPEAGRREAS